MKESDGVPKLYFIFEGEVASLQTYGAFVKIPGCKKQGLVHKSQMSSAKIDDPSEMLAKGEKVFCKVIAMEGDGEKISLSMKVVNQTTGKDMDPNNVQSSQDEKKRRQWNIKSQPKIQLGAELNTTCRKCGGHGHLAMDCFGGMLDNPYELIPDIDELTRTPPKEDDEEEQVLKKKKKKNKKTDKKKKKKKEKKRRVSSSSSSSSQSSEDETLSRDRKRKKVRKKTRSTSRSNSTSDASENERGREKKNRTAVRRELIDKSKSSGHDSKKDFDHLPNVRRDRSSSDHMKKQTSPDQILSRSCSGRKGRDSFSPDRSKQRDEPSRHNRGSFRDRRNDNRRRDRSGSSRDNYNQKRSRSVSPTGDKRGKSNSGREGHERKRSKSSSSEGSRRDGLYFGRNDQRRNKSRSSSSENHPRIRPNSGRDYRKRDRSSSDQRNDHSRRDRSDSGRNDHRRNRSRS